MTMYDDEHARVGEATPAGSTVPSSERTERSSGHSYQHPESEALLRRVSDMISGARPMPLSSSVMINKDEVLELLDEALERLPDELRAARWLLKEREEYLTKTRRDADDILDAARARAERMVQRTEVVKAAELRAQAKDAVVKHTHVVITFTQGGQLRYVDPRTFGELFITAPDELTKEITELADLGMDPVDEPQSWVKFREQLLGRTTKLKPLLMDQSFLAGVGNIYSDEILWESGLRHDRTPQSLSTMEIRRLYRAIVEVLHEAVKHRGSTLSDQQYVDIHGKPGEFQLLHQVYDREGEACRRCRSTIVREKLGSRSTFFCPNCQV